MNQIEPERVGGKVTMLGQHLRRLAATAALTLHLTPPAQADDRAQWAAPDALAISADGRDLFVGCAKSQRVLVLEAGSLRVQKSIALPGQPSGLVLSPDGQKLYATCAAPASTLVVIDLARGKVERGVPAGHTALAPALSPDGRTAYVCNRFNNEVEVIDLASGKEKARIPVDREPVAAAVTPDGRLLLVANHIHSGRADTDYVAARVSVIDTAAGRVIKELKLPNGSGILRDIRVSPDGRYACVTHVLARYQLPTTQIERGWINCNAVTLIDLSGVTILNTVLVDDVDRGAANPWACGWSADGKMLFVTHAGTHELSLIDFPALLAKLDRLPEKLEGQPTANYSASSRVRADVPNDLAFLTGLRQRVRLAGKGPRAAVIAGPLIFVASYFSDTIEVVDLARAHLGPTLSVHLSPEHTLPETQYGESLFNDASICLQGWQTCASCHSDDGRVDGLNWDLLNDGLGNPKNSKSLLLAHVTPPAMSLGIRDTAETAVRAGIRSILFTVQPEEVPTAIDTWLKSLTPIASPCLVNGQMSPAAKRGEKLFRSSQTRCSSCHPPGLFTDLHHYDVGTLATTDKAGDIFDTPTLVEIWRTAPYLHDGSAATLHEVLVEHNPHDRHGKTSHLSPRELDDLLAYLSSL
jgi:YVTN family beta-propeller protein